MFFNNTGYSSKPDTLAHKKNVSNKMKILIDDMILRSVSHDDSKLVSPEKEIFDEFTPKLKDSTYMSDEYKGFLKEMQVALDHHYSENRHHPEHFKNGIHDMNLVDILEMLADWKAASERHENGDILKSIELNKDRFGYSDDLKQLLINTVKYYF